MKNIVSKSFLRGVGIAATGGLLLGGPAMAGTRPSDQAPEAVTAVAAQDTAAPAATAEATPATARAADLQLAAVPAPAPAAVTAPEVAQTYAVPVVQEGFSAKGWYLTIGAGAQTPSDQTVNSNGRLVSPFFTPLLYNFGNNNSTKLNLGGGFSGDVGVGYDFGALRTEITYGYSRASLNAVGAANPIGLGVFGIVPFTNNVSGIINKNDVLWSLYYDFENNSRWTPYIGGGIGYTNLSTPSFSLNGFPTNSVNKGLFGWQAKLGVSYAVNYNSDIYIEGVYQGAGGYSSENLTFDSFNSWGGKVGFRYRFGSKPAAVVERPAPQPEPAPAPAPIRGLW